MVIKSFRFLILFLFLFSGTAKAEQYFTRGESSSAKRLFYFFLTSDGIVPAIGETGGQPTISINGGASVNTSSTLVHIDNGGYYVLLSSGEVGTLGKILVRYDSAGTVEFKDIGLIASPSSSDDISSVRNMLHRLILTTNWLKWKLEQTTRKTQQQGEVTQE